MIKKLVCILYVLVIIVMAVATIIGNAKGIDVAQQQIYGAWWFAVLWALLTAVGIVYIVKRRMRQWHLIVLHASFVIILIGALLTHLTSFQGMVHLRGNAPVRQYVTATTEGGEQAHDLPFAVRLDRFELVNHAGTDAAYDYVTHFSIVDAGKTIPARVSMNKIFTYRGIRFYQASYDTDNRGSYLSVNSDPWGLPVTYTGYALLFIALIWMLIDRRGTFRRLLRSEALRTAVLLLPLLAMAMPSEAQTTLPHETADRFGRLFIVYNGRICPMETFAIDFTKKITGRGHYENFSATQVLAGLMFWPEEWMQQPLFKVKGGALRERLGLDGHVAPTRFFSNEGYILGPYLADAQTANDAFSRQVMDNDDKLMLLMSVMQLSPMRVFPYTNKKGQVTWYTPTDRLPQSMPKAQQQYIHSILSLARDLARKGDWSTENELLDKMYRYQQRYGATTLPSKPQVRAERLYNHVPFTTILFIINLLAGFCSIAFLTRRHQHLYFTALMTLSWMALTIALVLRWVISGTIPLNNGYETMLSLAWFIMLIALLTSWRIHLMTTFGLLLSGFMLLVSHIADMDPAITPRMPVLNSPLLTVHVSIIMMAYALLSLTFICSLAWLIVHVIQKFKHSDIPSFGGAWEGLPAWEGLSLLFLFPAMTCLGLGIFIGAIWANVSWGNYWSWDPKETWALITFMVYAVPLHQASLPALQRPMVYHVYMLLAFLTLLITYFGVNYFMSGMHSYA